MIMRAARSYVETGSGLLVTGCGFDAKDVSSLNAVIKDKVISVSGLYFNIIISWLVMSC